MKSDRSPFLLSAVAAAAVGGVALAGGVADAAPVNDPFTSDDLNVFPYPVVDYYANTSTSHTELPAVGTFYRGSEDTYSWQVFDNAAHANVIGTFDSTTKHVEVNPWPFGYSTLSHVVTDSDDGGLPVGTQWTTSDLTLVLIPPVSGMVLSSAFSVSVPDEMQVDFWQVFGLGYESVVTDAGTSGFFYLFGDFIPLFDTPA